MSVKHKNHSIPNKPTLAALKTGLDFYRHYLQRHKKCGFYLAGYLLQSVAPKVGLTNYHTALSRHS